MDETIYKIALAGLFHDIGKFAERGGMSLSREYEMNNAGLYQPFNGRQNRHTHKHAVYTAAFIDYIEKLLPSQFNKAGWGLGDPFINLAAGHHKPDTPLQWIIAVADRISSGFDRHEFEDYSQEINVRDYKKSRLIPILEGLSLNEKWKDDSLLSYQYRYPLKELSPLSVFPVKGAEYQALDGKEAQGEYEKLFFDFVDALERLLHKDNVALWLDHFDTLFMIYTSHVPAASVGLVVPDVSLYDHSKSTAAFASALYRYHVETDTLSSENVQDYDVKKFLMIAGNFYGIQDFIFSQGGNTGKASAKLLRGRSFYVSLMSELAALAACEELGLSPLSIVLNAAGRFTILAANTASSKSGLTRAAETINDWLVETFYGEVSIGITEIEASPSDFVHDRFPELWKKLQNASDAAKFERLDLDRHGGVIAGYLGSFNNTLEKPLCPFCGKRPSSERVAADSEDACSICADHIYIGENLIKSDRIAVTTVDADLKGSQLTAPIFSRYQVSFDVSGSLSALSSSGTLLKYWDIGIHRDGTVSKEITAKFINGYVPRFSTIDKENETLDRLLAGQKSERTKDELFNMIRQESPKSFLHLAKMALNKQNKGSSDFCGIEALGTFKADVDNLGLLFALGLKKEMRTLSRMATMSRQLNNYFALYLPHALASKSRFQDVYTVFAGGDDLFLIGPWNRMIDLADFVADTFSEYVCHHPFITISAGISVTKPGVPVRTLAQMADDALDASKHKEGKASITLFGESVTWSAVRELRKIRDTLQGWLDNGIINHAMLYRFNDIAEMAKQERQLLKTGRAIELREMDCLKWRSSLKYAIARNTGRSIGGADRDEKRRAVEEVLKVVEWLESYRGAFRIALWQVIYNRR